MTNPPDLSDVDRADIHARLASWFGDDRQAFLVSHLAPVLDRIKSEAVAEFQRNALEMARKAERAERRAEDAEAELERLKAAADKVGHQAVCSDEPCDCWVRDLAPLLDGTEAQPERVVESEQGVDDDVWSVAVYRERDSCDHEWLDRPESDTASCDLCGEER